MKQTGSFACTLLLLVSFAGIGRCASGTLYAWGNNGAGALGNGTTTNGLVPAPVQNLTDVVTFAAVASHSLALKSGGRLYVWGYNNNGQLGLGDQVSRYLPVELTSLPNVSSADGGEAHSVACTADGKVYGWGGNGNGQLGIGNTTQYTTPQLVPGLSGIVQVLAGYAHTLALRSDGTVYAWGLNNLGQLGNGTQTDSLVPVAVTGLTGVKQISAGNNHSLAVKTDGTLWAWGSNVSGQLGTGGGTSTTPVQVTGLTGTVSQAVAGRNFSLALTGDGKAWSWGSNSYGQLGLGDATSRTIPTQITTVYPAISVSAGDFHIAVVRTDGTVWSSGYNASGQLGDGTTQLRSTPVQASGLTGVSSVCAKGSFTLALPSSGASRVVSLSFDSSVNYIFYPYRCGPSSTGTVTLDRPAPAGGIVVTLSVQFLEGIVNLVYPATFTIPQGQTQGTFILTADCPAPHPEVRNTVSVCASANGGSACAMWYLYEIPEICNVTTSTLPDFKVIGGYPMSLTATLCWSSPPGYQTITTVWPFGGLQSYLSPLTYSFDPGQSAKTIQVTIPLLPTETGGFWGWMNNDDIHYCAMISVQPQLEFITQPANAHVGTPFAQQPVIRKLNAAGVTDTSYNGPISVSIASGPTGAVLSGNTTVNAVKGVATFTDLSVSTVGTYTFYADITGSHAGTSSELGVSQPTATFNYSASSPGSLLLPTENNGSTQMAVDPQARTGLYTTTDIHAANLRLHTAVATADDIWTSVPFNIDLVIQDTATMASGLFTITGAISGATRVGASTLSLDYINIVPQCQTIGYFNYCITLPQGWYGTPMASPIPGVDGALGVLAVRVSAGSRYQTVDVTNALRISGGLQAPTELEAALSNVDSVSAGITTSDATLIARKVAGLDVNP